MSYTHGFNNTKMTKKIILTILAACAAVRGFTPSCRHHSLLARSLSTVPQRVASSLLQSAPNEAADASSDEITPEEEQRRIGNLVADEEWNGLSLELADIIRMAVVEDLKKNSREFLGKEEYLLGDFSKELDKRVKAEVAKIREKDEYEVSLSELYMYVSANLKSVAPNNLCTPNAFTVPLHEAGRSFGRVGRQGERARLSIIGEGRIRIWRSERTNRHEVEEVGGRVLR